MDDLQFDADGNPLPPPAPPSPAPPANNLLEQHSAALDGLYEMVGAIKSQLEGMQFPANNAEDGNPAKNAVGKKFPSQRRRTSPLGGSLVRDAALACALLPSQLHLLIPDTSDLHKEFEDHDKVELVTSSGTSLTLKGASSTSKKKYGTEKFIAEIPNPSTFLWAWSCYADLASYGLGSPREAQACFAALMWYGRWVVEKAATYTWESVAKYHIKFHLERSKKSFHYSLWYRAVDADKVTELVLRANSKSDHSAKVSGN